MNRVLLKTALNFLLTWLTICTYPAFAIDYPSAYGQFTNLKAEKLGTFIQPFFLKKDVVTLSFEQGDFTVCHPLGEVLNVIYFKGRGRFNYTPPLDAERDQLLRLYKTGTLDKEFTELLLLCNDSTMAQLALSVSLKTAPTYGYNPDRADYFLEYLKERKGQYYRTGLMKTILDGAPSGIFLAGIKTSEDHPLFYEIDPLEYEEVSLMQGRDENVFGKYLDVINQFHQAADRDGRPEADQASRQHVMIEGYNIACRIAKNLEITVRCRMDLLAQKEGQKWLYFYLSGYTYSPLEVDSAVWSSGKSTEFYKDPENMFLWVKAPQPLATGQRCTLTVYYRGSVLDKYYNWIYVKSSILWYPHGDYKNKSAFEATFHYPQDYSFISVGRCLDSSTQTGVTSSHWATAKPVRNFTFNLGFFKEYKMNEKGLPPVTILLSDAARSSYQHQSMASGEFLIIGKKMEKQVGADIVNSIAFYQKAFGPCPAEELVVCESPYSGGEAFPGIVNLSTSTFQNTSDQGYDEILRSHEVAHQWWAHGVGFTSYHDQWLSEGIAFFSGLWYMQTVLKNNKLFFEWLEKMRDAVMDTRKYLFSDGARAGSIWLGYRSSTTETPEDYSLVVYYKGAWVIQMLRNMMLDMNTMNEDKFIRAMQDFYTTYQGRTATTEDFMAVMGKHAGCDLGWFTRQWVYGDKIPEYKFSYTTAKTPEGKCKLTYRIEQTGVPGDFQMLIPLQFDFGSNQTARTRVLVKGPCTQNDLLLPMKPNEVVFNPFSSVLCRQETVDWK